MLTLRQRLAQLENESAADRKALLEQTITLDQWQARATQRSITYTNLITCLDIESGHLARLTTEFRQDKTDFANQVREASRS